MKRPMRDRLRGVLEEKGFYIVLFLCLAATGISGYYLFTSLSSPSAGDVPAGGEARVTVTASPAPSVQPTLAPTARPALRPTPTAQPAPTPTPAAESAAPRVGNVFTWPVRGDVLDAFSADKLRYDATMGDWRTHPGIDIAAAEGTPVRAAAGGTVVQVEADALMGTTVRIDHGEGLMSVYANLAPAVEVEVGDEVNTGDSVGAVGVTALAESSLAPHLHFSMLKDTVPADPMEYLPG